jgi:hypothetical protein
VDDDDDGDGDSGGGGGGGGGDDDNVTYYTRSKITHPPQVTATETAVTIEIMLQSERCSLC